MPTLLFTAFLALLGPQEIAAEAIGPGAWRMTLTVEGESDPIAASRHLQPRAAELCGEAGYHFGRYTFRTEQPADAAGQPAGAVTLTLVQDVACGPRPDAVAPVSPAPVLTEADADALRPRLEALSLRYFQAGDEGRHADAYAMADAAMTGGATLEEWTAREIGRLEQSGLVTSRVIGRYSWYSNPEGVPFGHYVAVDYVADRALEDECGYIVWYRPDLDSEFRLVRQETTFLPATLDAETRTALRQQHCIIL